MTSAIVYTAVSSEGRAKSGVWAVLAGKGRLLLSGSIVLPSLKAAVQDGPGQLTVGLD